jgi:hypothetical protein
MVQGKGSGQPDPLGLFVQELESSLPIHPDPQQLREIQINPSRIVRILTQEVPAPAQFGQRTTTVVRLVLALVIPLPVGHAIPYDIARLEIETPVIVSDRVHNFDSCGGGVTPAPQQYHGPGKPVELYLIIYR